MNNKATISIAILLLIAGLSIQYFDENIFSNFDQELLEFVSGMMIGIGIGLPIYIFFQKRKDIKG